MTNTRLARKARKLKRTEAEAELSKELGKLISERDKELHGANKKYHDSVTDSRKVLQDERSEAWKKYDESRNNLIKKYGQDETAAS